LAGICGQIFDAMRAAEQKSIIHRDIKPANILFKDGKVKIADWGFSRFLENGETTCSFLGSPAYMAP
jgi:serine/threonine protein kinase